jgi:hypothetical protein
VFLLSPAKMSGRRGAMLTREGADSELARELGTPEGAPISAVFAFVSGLYFRGKVAYAREFGRAPSGTPSAHVITAGGGLYQLDQRVTLARLNGWTRVAIHQDNPHFTAPLTRHAAGLLDAHDPTTRFVLLGSVATQKYVQPLLDVFGERLLFPSDFEGRGDMSRGSLMLRAVREGRELSYAPLLGVASPAARARARY